MLRINLKQINTQNNMIKKCFKCLTPIKSSLRDKIREHKSYYCTTARERCLIDDNIKYLEGIIGKIDTITQINFD